MRACRGPGTRRDTATVSPSFRSIRRPRVPARYGTAGTWRRRGQPISQSVNQRGNPLTAAPARNMRGFRGFTGSRVIGQPSFTQQLFPTLEVCAHQVESAPFVFVRKSRFSLHLQSNTTNTQVVAEGAAMLGSATDIGYILHIVPILGVCFAQHFVVMLTVNSQIWYLAKYSACSSAPPAIVECCGLFCAHSVLCRAAHVDTPPAPLFVT